MSKDAKTVSDFFEIIKNNIYVMEEEIYMIEERPDGEATETRKELEELSAAYEILKKHFPKGRV